MMIEVQEKFNLRVEENHVRPKENIVADLLRRGQNEKAEAGLKEQTRWIEEQGFME